MKPSILFICAGNTCRSPIAEYLTGKYYPGVFNVASGGIVVSRTYPNEKTIKAMQELFDIDISQHQPKYFMKYDLKVFDRVIAMDSHVFDAIQHKVPYLERILTWDIKDPFGKDYPEYVKCAKMIAEKIETQLKYFAVYD